MNLLFRTPTTYTNKSHLINSGANTAYRNKLKKCYGRNDVELITLNDEKIFDNLTASQKSEVDKKIGGTARKNPDIVRTAHDVAESMGVKNLEDFLSIIEIVAKEVGGKWLDLTVVTKPMLLTFFMQENLEMS